MLSMLKDRHDTYWFPLYYTTMWWWYGIRSGYAAPYREIETVQGVACRTLILTNGEGADDPEIVRLKELSPANLLTVETQPGDAAALFDKIKAFVIGDAHELAAMVRE